MSWFKKITSQLKKTSSKITQGLSKQKVGEKMLEELEERLIMADVGAETSAKIIKKFSKAKFGTEVTPEEIKQSLSDEIAFILKPYQKEFSHTTSPSIVLICGVNGNGKTTTIGKLAAHDIEAGKKVLLAACDTFRAAAVAQLQLWAEKTGASFVAGEPGADPASVAYKAVEKAKAEGFDVLYLDTAGRLHNNQNLMAELSKINRAVQKADANAPQATFMILDATTGQNALSQLEHFSKIVSISGIIVTKLDGTAKAGILIALATTFKIPIYFIGVGESQNDLKPFDAKEYAHALIG